MKQLIIFFIFFPLSLWADTTGNLLNQNFNTSDWSGTNKTSRHGNGTIAGVNDKYVESTISLSDTLTESQINNGWTSTLGSDIWHWNNYNSTTTMKQTITDADGTVTTQIREVDLTGCGSINCGGYTTYTDSYTQGINSQSDYDIAVRFTFEESSQSSGHYGTDLKNPTLTIEHSLITAEQATTLSEISETVDEIIETQVETIEFEPLEEFVFEVFEEPEMVVQLFEEIFFEETAVEEINTGIVNIFFEPVETMEVLYEEPQTLETFTTEIEIEEGIIETTEVGETIGETENPSGIIESEPLREEVSGGGSRETATEEVAGTGAGEISSENERGTNTESVATVSGSEEPVEETNNTPEQSETEDTVVAEKEITDESVGEGETTDSESGNGGTETVAQGEESIESRSESVEEGGDEGGVRVSTETISIENIERRVNATVTRTDQRLTLVSELVAKAMQNNKILDSYNNINQDIFNNQLTIDGGEYYETRKYVDDRNIYAQNQNIYNDMVSNYQERIEQADDEVIRTQEHLRRIRGY
jgi:hypothetical protein